MTSSRRVRRVTQRFAKDFFSALIGGLCALCVKEFSPPPKNPARQKTCKTLLQVKQSFVIKKPWGNWSAGLRPGAMLILLVTRRGGDRRSGVRVCVSGERSVYRDFRVR